ncbi:MAG: hypothetical protein MMC33_001922 [Icmadophila ericetorum]|nr:hypothetical protein [Icmadophila ericetorum]
MLGLLLSRYARTQRILLVTGSLVVYEGYHSAGRLRCDSVGNVEWPKKETLLIQERKYEGDVPLGNSLDAFAAGGKEAQDSNDGDSSTWEAISTRFTAIGDSITSIQWNSVGDTITDYIIPDWAKALPAYITKLQRELDMAPGSLADEIWQESQDVYINPEIALEAKVRISKDICTEEKEFLRRRRIHTAQALAKYLNLPEEEVNPEDVPTIAMCGSGGGLRALVAGTGSCLSAAEAGLFDCVTYTAGVSGSCWLQTLYNSSIGGQRHDKMVDHLKRRIGTHIAYPPAALGLLTQAPTNKFVLSGFIEKLKGDPAAAFGLVDIYGLLLGARLLIPRGDLGVENGDLKLSNQRAYVEKGQNPLPIYTAVRHEIPLEENASQLEKIAGSPSEQTKEIAKQESWFQWFEFTPYEFWCEELEAGIPTWSIGRKFKNGRSICRENGFSLPELRIPLLMGIWGSAFCATLQHYFKEVRPLFMGLPGFIGLDDIITERNDDLIKVHPIDPAAINNFALGLEDQLPPTCPKSIFNSSHLQLMDAGMSNNLPIYPLLRPGRDIDIIIAFDASADIKSENWLSIVDGYAKQRGVKGYPLGAGWPKSNETKEEIRDELEAAAIQSASPQEAATEIADLREEQREEHNQTQEAVQKGKTADPNDSDLGYCTVWIGSTSQRTSPQEPPPSKRFNLDATSWEPLGPDTGLALIYFPFLPNPKCEGVDPNTSDFMSTWNFVYTPEQVDMVVGLARANFEEGKEQTKRCVRAVWERKRRLRVERERGERWRGL